MAKQSKSTKKKQISSPSSKTSSAPSKQLRAKTTGDPRHASVPKRRKSIKNTRSTQQKTKKVSPTSMRSTTGKRFTFAVVIPTYNERKNIEKLLPLLRKMYPHGHVFVVDDNSPDRTWKFVETAALKDPYIHLVFQKEKQGLGRAYIRGFKRALTVQEVEYIVQMDADFSHDPKSIRDLLLQVQECDVAIGSRYKRGISAWEWSLYRILGSYVVNKYVQLITGLPIKDATGGYKCFRRNVLEQINFKQIKSFGYCFQAEVNYIVYKMGFSIGEVPILFRERDEGKSKLSIGIVFEELIRVLLFRFRRIKSVKKER